MGFMPDVILFDSPVKRPIRRRDGLHSLWHKSDPMPWRRSVLVSSPVLPIPGGRTGEAVSQCDPRFEPEHPADLGDVHAASVHLARLPGPEPDLLRPPHHLLAEPGQL